MYEVEYMRVIVDECYNIVVTNRMLNKMSNDRIDKILKNHPEWKMIWWPTYL